MSGLRAAAVEWGGFTPLGLNLSLGRDGMVASLLNETGVNQLSGVNRKDRSSITPEEAVLIQQFRDVEEKNPLAANKVVLDSGRKVLDVIGMGTSQPAVIYQAEEDDFKFHPKIGFKYRGRHFFGPGEAFGKAQPLLESENLVETVVSDFNTFVLDAVTIGAMPLVGAGNLIKSIEPATKLLFAKAAGKKVDLSKEFKTLYETIADQSVMEASPVLSKYLLGVTSLAVMFSPIVSTLNLKDVKTFGKAVNDGLELDHGISFNTPDGKPPHVPRWVYLIPGGIVLWGILSACNEATKRPPAVTVSTVTPVPTETPKPPATLTSTPSPTPELAITPNGGKGGAEFRPGSIQDLQASIDLGSFSPARCVSADIESSAYKSERAKLGPEANVELLRNELLKKIDPEQGQVLESLCVQGSWLFKALDKDKNIMWSWNQVKKNWADHPDSVLTGGWEFRSIKVRPGYKADFSIDRFGQPWLVELTKDGVPVRYFDTVSGTFLYFDFKTLFGSEKLINSSGWDATAGARVSNGILEISGNRGDWNMVSNPEIKLGNIKGPFSVRTEFVIKDGGTDGGLVLTDRSQRGLKNWWDLRRLDFTVNLKPGGQSGLWIGYTNFSKDQIALKYENSIPIFENGKNIIDVKFITDTKQMVVTINGRELRPVAIPDGFLDNNTIIPGFSAGPNAIINVSELSIRTPGAGQDNIRLLNVATATPTTVIATSLPAVTTVPKFTPVPPAIKTPEPSKGPRLLTYNEGQNLLNNLSLLSECLAPARLGDLPDNTINGWRYIRKGIKSVVGTVVNYPDGQSFDVKSAKRTVLYVFSNPPGGQEIIHMTNISPALVLPYLSSGDYLGVTISPKDEIDGIYLLCYYK